MSKIALSGNPSGTGTLTIAAPNTNSDRTLTLPDASGTVAVQGGAISGTTGTFTGLLDISAAGAGQIQFPATQNASANANTLDDYEEGTWTPTIKFGATDATVTSQGFYTKVGNCVTVSFFFSLSNKNGGTGAMSVYGFPFNSGATQSQRGGAAIGYYTQFISFPFFMLDAGSSAGNFRKGNSTDFNNTEVPDGASVYASYTYLI